MNEGAMYTANTHFLNRHPLRRLNEELVKFL